MCVHEQTVYLNKTSVHGEYIAVNVHAPYTGHNPVPGKQKK